MNLIPWLAGALTSLIGWFSAWLTAKVAVAAAAVLMVTTLWVAFCLAIVAIAGALSASFPGWAVAGMMFVPTNAPGCISALMTARLVRLAFNYKREMLRTISYIT